MNFSIIAGIFSIAVTIGILYLVYKMVKAFFGYRK